MTKKRQSRRRRLESDTSPSACSPVATREDSLSPSRALRDTVGATGSQRAGSGLPLDSPVVSFPDNHEIRADVEGEGREPRHDEPPRGDGRSGEPDARQR